MMAERGNVTLLAIIVLLMLTLALAVIIVPPLFVLG